MGTTPKLVELKPLANFRMWVRYDDGSQGEVDFVDLAGRGVFSAWEIGRSFRVGDNRATWGVGLER